MAGTRRGSDRKEASDAFEDANPFLKRVETRIEVAPREEDEEEGPKKKGPPEAFDIIITEEGEIVEGFVNIDRIGGPRTVANSAETPVGVIEAFDPEAEFQGPNPERFVNLVLSDEGFGVVNRRDRETGEGPQTEDFALDGGESLQFLINPFFKIGLLEGDLAKFDGPFFFPGGIDFGIDFTVLDGSGTVQIELQDNFGERRGAVDPDDGFVVGGASSGTVSGEGTTGSLEAFLMGGEEEPFVYNAAIVTVTGDLQIAVTGIDVTTNFDGNPFFGVPN